MFLCGKFYIYITTLKAVRLGEKLLIVMVMESQQLPLLECCQSFVQNYIFILNLCNEFFVYSSSKLAKNPWKTIYFIDGIGCTHRIRVISDFESFLTSGLIAKLSLSWNNFKILFNKREQFEKLFVHIPIKENNTIRGSMNKSNEMVIFNM